MRIAVLGSPNSWYLDDLRRAAQGQHEVVPVPFTQIRSAIESPNALDVHAGQVDLEQFDVVLVRTMPPGSLEQVVFRMDVLGLWQATGHLVINAPRAIEAAVDKYLALAKLQAAGLVVPRTCVCQTVDEAMEAYASLGGDVVIKPIFCSEGRGIARVSDEALALRASKMLVQCGAVVYLQEFIAHEGYDLRLLVIGEEVLGMRRRNPGDWRTNVSRGAVTEPMPVNRSLADVAHRAADAVGAVLAGVDLLPGRDGQLYAIEVNAVPGWKALARTLNTDVAARVLRYLQQTQ